MLVVVEDRDVQILLQPLFDLEAPRGRDILQVYAAECRRNVLDGLDYRVRILGVETDRERVHVRELLEERRLALHHGHRGQRPYVPEPEDGSTVRDHSDRIALYGKVESLGVTGYRPADARYTWRVDHREVVAGADLELGADFDLTPKVHQERPVRDVDDPDLGQVLDDLNHLLAMLGVTGVDGNIAGGSVLAHPHYVDGTDHSVSIPYGRQNLPEGSRLVRKLDP